VLEFLEQEISCAIFVHMDTLSEINKLKEQLARKGDVTTK